MSKRGENLNLEVTSYNVEIEHFKLTVNGNYYNDGLNDDIINCSACIRTCAACVEKTTAMMTVVSHMRLQMHTKHYIHHLWFTRACKQLTVEYIQPTNSD